MLFVINFSRKSGFAQQIFAEEKKFFLKHEGMDSKRYTGEDKEFFDRVRKKNPGLKVFYSPDLFIYHKERNYMGLLLQRSCFGMDFLNLIKFKILFI